MRKFRFDRLDAWQASLEFDWQLFQVSELRDPHRCCRVAKRVLDNQSPLALAEDESNAWVVGRVFEHVIDGGQVEVHLACVLRLERAGLQIDDNEAPEFEVIEEEVDLVVLAGDLQPVLTANEGEARSQFEEELLDVLNESGFYVSLISILGQCEEIEVVGIFQELLGQIGLGRW